MVLKDVILHSMSYGPGSHDSWYLAFRPEEIRKIFEMLDHAAEGCTGHGLVHLLVYSASLLDWTWNAGLQAWCRLGLPALHILAVPIQHSPNVFSMLGVPRLPKTFDREMVSWWPILGYCCFSAALCLISCQGTRQRITWRHSGSVWNGFFTRTGPRRSRSLLVLWWA